MDGFDPVALIVYADVDGVAEVGAEKIVRYLEGYGVFRAMGDMADDFCL